MTRNGTHIDSGIPPVGVPFAQVEPQVESAPKETRQPMERDSNLQTSQGNYTRTKLQRSSTLKNLDRGWQASPSYFLQDMIDSKRIAKPLTVIASFRLRCWWVEFPDPDQLSELKVPGVSRFSVKVRLKV